MPPTPRPPARHRLSLELVDLAAPPSGASQESALSEARDRDDAASRAPPTGWGTQIEAKAISHSDSEASFAKGARVFHIKFGPGEVVGVDGVKLTVDFDKAGRKMVLESYLQKAG